MTRASAGADATQRSDADYTAEVVFTAESATEDVERARRFMAAVSSLLVSEGWIVE